jgi:transcriptional regulator with XRE-family HTH domain
MPEFNAYFVNAVNAYSANPVRQSSRMGKKATTPASPFWKRLEECWAEKKLPVSQNGVADKLDMSQGSVQRWYRGFGLPETENLIEIASKGGVTVQWLLTGDLPKRPVQPGSELHRLLEIWAVVDPEDKSHILRAAEGQLARRTKGSPDPVLVKSSGKRVAA